MKPKMLGNMNAQWLCKYTYKGRSVYECQHTLGAARASLALKAPVGATITRHDSILGTGKVLILPSGGGDRTPDGRWARRI